MIHLLTGKSPFEGLGDDEIVDRHFQGEIPIPEDVSEEFRALLRGLLRQSANLRWGYKQVRAWLKGAPILTDGGLPDRDERYFGREISYPECAAAKNPVQLARHLEDFDAARELFRGRISLWVKLFDPQMAERIVEIEEQYTEDPEKGLLKLRYLLDASLPLTIAGCDIHDIRELGKALTSKDRALLEGIKEAFWDGTIETWIGAIYSDARGRELAGRIKGFRQRHRGRRQMGILHLAFMLDPSAPLGLGQGHQARTPEELAEAAHVPELNKAVKAYLFSGQAAAWLEIAFPERPEDARFLRQAALDYQQNSDLGLEALYWYFRPEAPFTLGGKQIHDPAALAALIDQNEAGQRYGLEIVQNGRLRTWLMSTGRLVDPSVFDAIASNETFSSEVKLEMILRLLDPELPKPVLETDTKKVDLGLVEAGGSKTAEIEFINSGRGTLTGEVRVEGAGSDVLLDPCKLEGHRTLVRIKAQPAHYLADGVARQANIIVESNGGGLQIPLTYRIVKLVAVPEPESQPAKDSPLGRMLKWVGDLIR